METQVPDFTYLPISPINKHYPCILLDGHIYHPIENLSKFQNQLGFTHDIATLGIELQNFIWEKFVKNAAEHCNSCFQLNVIEYLIVNSFNFTIEYGKQYDKWILHHQNLRSKNILKCCECDDKLIARHILLIENTHR